MTENMCDDFKLATRLLLDYFTTQLKHERPYVLLRKARFYSHWKPLRMAVSFPYGTDTVCGIEDSNTKLRTFLEQNGMAPVFSTWQNARI